MASKAKVKKALIEQLRRKGADNDANLALVEDYVNYFLLEAAAIKDLRDRGATYKAISSQGKMYDKDNPSKKDAIEYNKRKLDILKTLGLNEPPEPEEEDDEL